MEEDKILINTQYERERFKEHLSEVNNYRILFSGKYGCGKTYFLQEYFDIKKNEYEAFHLFPTNYAVSSNEDIIKLLQFDILYEIIRKGLLEPSEKMFTDKDLIVPFLKNNASNIIRDVISHCTSIGKKLADIFDNSQKWLTDYEEFKKQMNETDSDKARTTFEKLLKEVEYDASTELIEMVLSNIENKQKVLIIDDLDRIDPEHIFRLLNVFSAQLSCYFSTHTSTPQNDNRFGFDKVIFVCDMDNIRNIYHAKYGEKTDFGGYIDKFYSIAPYSFNNNAQIVHEAHRFVRSIRSESPDSNIGILSSITRILLYHNVISLRQLVEKESAKWDFPIRKYTQLSNEYSKSAILFVDFILFLFGTKHDAIKALSNHKEEVDYAKIQTEYRMTEMFIPFLMDVSDKPIDSSIVEYKNEELNITIKFIRIKGDREVYLDIESISNYDGSARTTIPYFQLLAMALDTYCAKAEESKIYHY